ncbi:MAG: amidohydrolase family protein, partial [Sediminibacterium sp.]|nr:amidohydrolase family protein [Sediminibacterium sp.]
RVENIAINENEQSIHFKDAIAFPGLINSHDHLDFNLFPALGNRIYANYMEWGEDIHARNAGTIAQVLQVPLALRVQWGMYKNLLNGFTTVINHGEPLEINDPLLTVCQHAVSLHSVGFEKNWRWKLNKSRHGNKLVAIHIGEGTDQLAAKEIDSLLRWNFSRKRLIGIHGVAMTAVQAKAFRALVWCPASNFFLLNTTAKLNDLRPHVPVLFGSDATLTGDWNIWNQIRDARATRLLNDIELFESLTTAPATAWELKETGSVREGFAADVVIARKKANTALDSFYRLHPEDLLLIVNRGEVKMFDASLYPQLFAKAAGFSKVMLGQQVKFVSGDLHTLMNSITRHYPEVRWPAEIAACMKPAGSYASFLKTATA